jgi:hypothetical protein
MTFASHSLGCRFQVESCRPPTRAFGRALKHLVLFARQLFNVQSPRFAKYQPALRLGTRRVEQRLLGRIARAAMENSC